MSRFDCVIWDWNGTLMNDACVSCGAVNDMLCEFGRPATDMPTYFHYMRDGMDKYYDYLFYPDKAPFDKLVVMFSKYYDERIKTASLHKGTEAVLEALRSMGITQTIVSSSHKNKVRRDAAAFGIDKYFDEVLGADDLLVGSKTERARLYLERKGFSPERTLLVGDMTHDMETAAGIGAHCVVIPKGHQTRELLESKGANMLSDITDIIEYVK